jgi:hypothetical protein
MIGILLRSFDKETIEEFFQLFKTPWGFFEEGQNYQVIISDDRDAVQLKAQMVIILDEETKGKDVLNKNTGYRETVELLKVGNDTFPVYTGVKTTKGGSTVVQVVSSGLPVGNRIQHDKKSILYLGYNFFSEFRYIMNEGQPISFASYPTIDIHIDNLRKWILEAGLSLVEIPPVPSGHRFFGCLTHDVDFVGIRNHMFDHTTAGFLYRALIGSSVRFLNRGYPLKNLLLNWMAVCALPLVHLGLVKDFWYQFKNYTEIEKTSGSTFFLVPFKNNPGKVQNGIAPNIRAVKYEVNDVKDEINYLLENGCEIAVHGIDSWLDINCGKEELKKIRQLTGRLDVGVRMHWLYFKPESPKLLEKAGYSYDSTLGYNETIGYKSGTHQVFRPRGTSVLLELPMHIMDTALFYPDHMNLSLGDGMRLISQYIHKAARFGGALTFNWHHRSIAPERLWGDVYDEVLSELRLQGAKISTAGNVVEWFRARRAIGFSGFALDGASVKLILSGDLPKLNEIKMVRIYYPQRYCNPGAENGIRKDAFSDYTIDRKIEMNIFRAN